MSAMLRRMARQFRVLDDRRRSLMKRLDSLSIPWLASVKCWSWLLLTLLCDCGALAQEDVLPGTLLLRMPENHLPEFLMDGAHRLIERKISHAEENRGQFWPPVGAKSEAWGNAVDENREQLRTIIGAVDTRFPSRMEYFGDSPEGAVVFRNEDFRILQVRWSVLEDVWGEGLLQISCCEYSNKKPVQDGIR